MRHTWMFAALAALSLTTSASAQEVDQNTRQQIEQIAGACHENWNKHDAAGIANLYTDDGIFLAGGTGTKKGRNEIEDFCANNTFKTLSHHDSATVDEVFPFENNAVIVVGEYHLSGQGQNGPIKEDGHYTAVDVLQGNTWKIRLSTATATPPPTPTAR